MHRSRDRLLVCFDRNASKSIMALVSGGRSTLNPNAPLFIPAAVQQVEDFSPEWWNLVTTATWFRDYWLSEHHGEDIFGEEDNANDVVGLLPDTIDVGVDEDILNMEAQYEEFLQSETHHHRGFGKNAGVLVKSMSFPRERGPISPNYWEKPAKIVSPRCGPRFIQQPR
ncbi:hypothetical protein ACP275_11G011600 [Erythranthe tilingii]